MRCVSTVKDLKILKEMDVGEDSEGGKFCGVE